ncbi:NAD(P)-dependent oxidoreductase [Kitasatospora sp. NPDC057223]|uniref:NAD(P)-dependent oxidoreductase n=1 Tax=Kitasatospora sp. NPDC057223 TaxID=3346055 RepID=UPI003635F261
MQITLLGATGPTGQQVLRQALEAGHHVTALVRDPARLPQRDDDRVTVITGDATDTDAVERALHGSRAVVSALGPGKDFTSTLATRAADAVLAAMADSGVGRLVWLSALGAGATARQQSVIQSAASRLLMSRLMADKGVADDRIAGGGPDWTVALPVMLTNGPHTGTYRTIDADSGTGRIGGRVSRADVADFLLKAATTEEGTRRRVILTR